MDTEGALLSVNHLRVTFQTEDGKVPAVRGVSFDVKPGETLGIVGESGCGKSVTALSLLKLLPPSATMECDSLKFENNNIAHSSDSDMEKIRGRDIGMIFQEPMTSLNPVYTVEHQIAEALHLHHPELPETAVVERVIELLRSVGIPAPEERIKSYPHELSGGMRQRVMIAMALACKPKLLIADEPTTALDVTIQAQILDILAGLKKKLGMSVILITHDLGVVAQNADEVIVMYGGQVVEKAPVRELFTHPLHPYTQGLLSSVPSKEAGSHRKRLESIPGNVPAPQNLPTGCAFQDRCGKVQPTCKTSEPPLESKGPQHEVRCFVVEAKA